MPTPIIIPGGALRGPLFASLLRKNAPEPGLPSGTMVGSYRIESVIGRGGSGVVYRAQRDDGTFAQTVALKVVRADPLQREHLRRERDILGRFHHPGIARIHDGGETENGDPWYAMEYVSGQRIDRWCDEHNADWRLRIRILLAVCDAVSYAHARLIVHQDLKPSNVLVDDDGFPRLLDFGISRAVREGSGADEVLSFTPGIASPEQLAGMPATTSTDVFQLGRLAELILKSDVSPRSGSRSIKRNIDAVVERATAPSPEQRYPTVKDLHADLNRILHGRPVLARSWSPFARTIFFVTRNGLPLAIASAAVALLAGSIFYYTIRLRAERDHAAEEARVSRISNEVLSNLFRTAPSSAQGEQMSTAQVLDRAAITTLKRLDAAPTQRDIAAASIATAHLDLQSPDKARAVLDDALGYAPDSDDDAMLQRARIQVLRARAAVEEKDFEKAESMLAAAEPILKTRPDRALDTDALKAVRITLAAREGHPADAARRRDDLIAEMQSQRLIDDPLYASLLDARSTQRSLANDYDGAKRDIDQAHAIIARHYGPSSPLALEMERTRVWLDMNSGALADADGRLEAQKRTVQESFGRDSLEYAAVLTFEGNTAGELGDVTKQESAYDEAYRILKAQQHPDSINLATMAHNLGDLALERNDATRALPLYEEALRIRRLTFPENYQPVLINRLQMARAKCLLGSYATANATFSDVRAEMAKQIAPGHAYLAVAAAMQVDCLRTQGRMSEARTLFDRELSTNTRNGLKGRTADRVERVRVALEQQSKQPLP
jgi:eukaryotic-like serine/threonine-protein kinase